MKSLVHFCRFLAGIDEPESQVTSAELEVLCRYARYAKIICEIGCFEGRTSVALAHACKGTVYAIDPFFGGRAGIAYGELIARVYRRRAHANNLLFVKGLSIDVARRFDKPVDMLFIDADHSYEAVEADWNSWLPKLQGDGVVALHDCKLSVNSPVDLGSMKFYDNKIRRMANVQEIHSVDSLVVLRVRNGA